MADPRSTPSLPVAPSGKRGGREKKGWPLGAALAAAALIAAGGTLWKLSGRTSAGGPTEGELTTVKRGPLTISFNERGTIKAAKSEQVFSKLEGMSSIVNVVKEGTFVKKGDVLVELDSSDLTQLLNQQTITVDTAAAALTTANEQVEIQKSQNESDIQAAKLAVEFAKIDKEKYEKGDYRLAFEKAVADIDIAKEETARAQNKLQWTQKLTEKGYVTKTELIADQITEHKANVQSSQAQKSLEVLENYTKKKDSMKVTSDLEQAQRALERVQRKANSLMSQSLADQKAKQSTHSLSLRRLNKLKDQIEKTKMIALQDGMVVYFQEGHWGREDRMIEQGATVRENQHLIDLPDLSVMAVSVQVPEARIHQVKVGLTATVTIDAQTELALRGTVTKIGLLPDYVNRWLNPDLKVYSTDITIDSYQDIKLLRPGMSAKVEILIDQIEDALFVPIQSVTTIDGQQVCFVLSGKDFQPKKVDVGQSNNTFLQILSGLAEGETIKLNAPRPQGTPPAKKEMRPDEITNGGDSFPVPAAFKDGENDRQEGKRRRPPGPGEPEIPGVGEKADVAEKPDLGEGPNEAGKRPDRKKRSGMRRPPFGDPAEEPGAAAKGEVKTVDDKAVVPGEPSSAPAPAASAGKGPSDPAPEKKSTSS